MPAAAPAVSCSRCYVHSATGRATGRGAAAHCQRSGARQSSQASRSTRSPTCGAAGSCSRSARALLRDKKKAGSAVPALLRLAALLPATRALAACSTWQRRTFAHTQGLEGRFVAHGHLARLHDESQARVDALNSRLLLLQSTGEHRHAEATAVAGGHWAAHKRCEQVDRVAGGAGGARTLVGAGSYGRGAHLALARVAHRCSRDRHVQAREGGHNARTKRGLSAIGGFRPVFSVASTVTGTFLSLRNRWRRVGRHRRAYSLARVRAAVP